MLKTIEKIAAEIISDIWDDSIEIPVFSTTYNMGADYAGITWEHENTVFIDFNFAWISEENHMFALIAHELIHAWQFENGIAEPEKGGHGKTFKKWAKEIGEFYNIKISRYTNIEF